MEPSGARSDSLGLTAKDRTGTNASQSRSAEAAELAGSRNKLAGYYYCLLLVSCASITSICLHIQQWVGLAFYWGNRKWFSSWQAHVKESTALLLIALNQWRAPVTMHISGDDSIDGQILRTPEGKISCQFPERMILVANHQLYTDWLFLWWTAYIAGYHGYLIIILKDAIKKIPIVGSGMQFFSWIFLSRRWETDQTRLRQSIDALSDPVQKSPMWLLIFPEGTNLSKRSMSLSQKWAAETGVTPFELTLLPRSRGLQVCIEGLRGSVDWLYDCTIAYEDIPPGVDGQDVYNLYSLYIQGRPAPVTHIHWRRCAIERIPFDDPQAFDRWLYQWWAEKEQLLQHFKSSGRFPASGKYVQAEVKLEKAREALQGLTSLFAIAAAWWALALIYRNIVGL